MRNVNPDSAPQEAAQVLVFAWDEAYRLKLLETIRQDRTEVKAELPGFRLPTVNGEMHPGIDPTSNAQMLDIADGIIDPP